MEQRETSGLLEKTSVGEAETNFSRVSAGFVDSICRVCLLHGWAFLTNRGMLLHVLHVANIYGYEPVFLTIIIQ